MTTLAVVGNSHVYALQAALGADARGIISALPAGLELSFAVVRIDLGDALIWKGMPTVSGYEIVGSWHDALVDVIGGADYVVIQWDGNQMNTRALIGHGVAFDVVLPDDGADVVVDATEMIPYAVVHHFVQSSLRNSAQLAKLMELCAARGGRPLAFLGPPPPLPSHAIRERLAHETYFVEKANDLGIPLDDVPLVDDAVRSRLWQILIDTYRGFAAEAGATFLDPPASAKDASGVLKDEYWGRDATHANGEYGSHYLTTVLDWLPEAARV
jgi:hypothetical protein